MTRPDVGYLAPSDAAAARAAAAAALAHLPQPVRQQESPRTTACFGPDDVASSTDSSPPPLPPAGSARGRIVLPDSIPGMVHVLVTPPAPPRARGAVKDASTAANSSAGVGAAHPQWPAMQRQPQGPGANGWQPRGLLQPQQQHTRPTSAPQPQLQPQLTPPPPPQVLVMPQRGSSAPQSQPQPQQWQHRHGPQAHIGYGVCPPEHIAMVIGNALARIQTEFPRLPPPLQLASLEAAALAASGLQEEAVAATAGHRKGIPWMHLAAVADAQEGMPRAQLTAVVGTFLQLRQQTFVDGSETPSAGGNPVLGASRYGAAHLLPFASEAAVRTALLLCCAQVQLADPRTADAAAQTLAFPEVPTAVRASLPDAAAKWLASGGPALLHRSAMQDGLAALLQLAAAGMVVSADIDFGVRQLVAPDGNGGSGSAMVSGVGSDANSHETQQQRNHARSSVFHAAPPGSMFLRQFRLRREAPTASGAVHLMDVSAAPVLQGAFAYMDDFDLSRHAEQAFGASAANQDVEDAQQTGTAANCVCAEFRQHDEYTVTVAANCSADTDRRPASGVFQQLVLFTLLVPSALAQSVAPSCRCPVPGTSGNTTAVVIGRRVTVALVDSLRTFDSMLSADAKPFVASYLRLLFDTRPRLWQHMANPFATLLTMTHEPWSPAADSENQPGWTQGSIAACRMAGLQPLATDVDVQSALEAAARQHLQRLSRLLLVEEACMEVDIKRYDLFNVRLQRAVFNGPGRQYWVGALGDAPTAKGAGLPGARLYRGPSLKLLPEVAGKRWPDLLVLDAPGILEGRPALLPGDTIFLRPGKELDTEYGTKLLATDGTTCLLVSPVSFFSTRSGGAGTLRAKSWGRDDLFHVRFGFDRTPFRRMHSALAAAAQSPVLRLLPVDGSADAAEPQIQVALPSEEHLQRVAATVEEHGAQQLNAEQRRAVAAMLCSSGEAVYALNGPPGTGKTVTLVETALQIFHRMPASRLLLCAPQNYSADLLVSALAAAGIQPKQMLRLNDPRRPPPQAKEDTLPYCILDEDLRTFALPELQQAAKFRIVVCTCSAAGILREGQYASAAASQPLQNTFTHVLIDEAGQAVEPETLVPMSLLGPGGGSVMLCGDPRQLGPIVRSLRAQRGGLAVSLLERLTAHYRRLAPAYAQRGLAAPCSMLVRNYRSHRQLLMLPSRMFYQSSLIAAASPDSVLPPRWDLMHQSKDGAAAGTHDAGDSQVADEEASGSEEVFDEDLLPASVLFYGVRGAQLREGEAPSYFNPVEAAVLVDLVAGLLRQHEGSAVNVNPSDIGVIATYRKQVQKIRLLFRQRGLGAIRVGTVDDYQGQEERIVFISTVLSRPETLPPASAAQPSARQRASQEDVHLGFWRNPKRFNVAITRAKALLVVVGHPVLLLEDASWRELIKFCAARGAYCGAGAAHMRALMRDGGDGGDDGTLFGAGAGDVNGGGETEEDVNAAVQQIAEMALLGAGCADVMYPSSLDEFYEQAADELVFRVAL